MRHNSNFCNIWDNNPNNRVSGNASPLALQQQLMGPEGLFVGHGQKALDAVAQIQLRNAVPAAEMHQVQNVEGARTAPALVRVKVRSRASSAVAPKSRRSSRHPNSRNAYGRTPS